MTPDSEFYFRQILISEQQALLGNPTKRPSQFSQARTSVRYDSKIFEALQVKRYSEMEWREDAEFYLLLSIRMMILEPYYQTGMGRMKDSLFRPVDEMLAVDMRKLVQSAENYARQRDREYVSSTSVSKAIGSNAENLEITSSKLWGS